MKDYYSVSELITNFKISKETFYKIKGKNKQLFMDNSIKVKEEGKSGKPIFKYNQTIFDFFASHYGQEGSASSDAGADPSFFKSASTGGTSTSPENPTTPQVEEEAPTPPETKIRALEAEIEALRAQLEEAKREKAEIQNQLGIALLCLQQEKAEKQLLLPAPKKGIGARIKGLFGKKTK